MPGTALTMPEREDISRGLVDGETFTDIAGRIGRYKSTVSREVARYGGRDAYRAYQAQKAAQQALKRPKPSKLATDRRLRDEVEARPRCDKKLSAMKNTRRAAV